MSKLWREMSQKTARERGRMVERVRGKGQEGLLQEFLRDQSKEMHSTHRSETVEGNRGQRPVDTGAEEESQRVVQKAARRALLTGDKFQYWETITIKNQSGNTQILVEIVMETFLKCVKETFLCLYVTKHIRVGGADPPSVLDIMQTDYNMEIENIRDDTPPGKK